MSESVKPTAEELSYSLRSEVCPGCGGHKGEGLPLCGTDWKRVKKYTKQWLRNDTGPAYVEVMHMALEELGVTEFKVTPKAPPRTPGFLARMFHRTWTPPKKTKAQERREATGADRTQEVLPRERGGLVDRVAFRLEAHVEWNRTRPGYRKLTVNPKKLRRLIKAEMAKVAA